MVAFIPLSTIPVLGVIYFKFGILPVVNNSTIFAPLIIPLYYPPPFLPAFKYLPNVNYTLLYLALARCSPSPSLCSMVSCLSQYVIQCVNSHVLSPTNSKEGRIVHGCHNPIGNTNQVSHYLIMLHILSEITRKDS